ncbi:hypothetical protein LMG27177_05885 [Paraburkholderia fynbosensis]|uniref:Uncharacterized protein n=1 Tax=Paraburkholderia fynbosensis TaxID=1200993 RepID=A0A6J5GR59_9BURK|nr:hypothetical protein LMG27177_05885 [Paraburkholderia fynbosensis]
MSHAINLGRAMALATAPLFVVCRGGKADNLGSIDTPQCSGAICGVQACPHGYQRGRIMPRYRRHRPNHLSGRSGKR